VHFLFSLKFQGGMEKKGIHPVRACVKVAELRKRGYSDLEDWCSPNHGNMLVCRRGRVFITDPKTKAKRVFSYPSSRYCNPFRLSEYSLKASLARYEQYMWERLWSDESFEIQFVEDMSAARELGCYCEKDNQCHVDILLKIFSAYFPLTFQLGTDRDF